MEDLKPSVTLYLTSATVAFIGMWLVLMDMMQRSRTLPPDTAMSDLWELNIWSEWGGILVCQSLLLFLLGIKCDRSGV